MAQEEHVLLAGEQQMTAAQTKDHKEEQIHDAVSPGVVLIPHPSTKSRPVMFFSS